MGRIVGITYPTLKEMPKETPKPTKETAASVDTGCSREAKGGGKAKE